MNSFDAATKSPSALRKFRRGLVVAGTSCAVIAATLLAGSGTANAAPATVTKSNGPLSLTVPTIVNQTQGCILYKLPLTTSATLGPNDLMFLDLDVNDPKGQPDGLDSLSVSGPAATATYTIGTATDGYPPPLQICGISEVGTYSIVGTEQLKTYDANFVETDYNYKVVLPIVVRSQSVVSEKASATSVKKGHAAKVSGTLTTFSTTGSNFNQVPIAGRLTVQYQLIGHPTWHTLKVINVGRNGKYSVTFHPAHSERIRTVYAGTPAHQSAKSLTRTIKVK